MIWVRHWKRCVIILCASASYVFAVENAACETKSRNINQIASQIKDLTEISMPKGISDITFLGAKEISLNGEQVYENYKVAGKVIRLNYLNSPNAPVDLITYLFVSVGLDGNPWTEVPVVGLAGELTINSTGGRGDDNSVFLGKARINQIDETVLIISQLRTNASPPPPSVAHLSIYVFDPGEFDDGEMQSPPAWKLFKRYDSINKYRDATEASCSELINKLLKKTRYCQIQY